MGNLKAGVVVGITWGVWHLNNITLGFVFLLYILWTTEMSIIMTWLHYKGNRNILLAVIFHSMINITTSYLSSFEHLKFGALFLAVAVGVFGVPAIVLAWRSPIFTHK